MKNKNEPHKIGMRWYNFLIYFTLIVGAVINIIYGFSYISGGIYFVESNGDVSAEQVYAYYGAGLQVVDVLYGLYLLAFAVSALVLRQKLVNYTTDAPKFVKIFYSIYAGVPFLYSITYALITEQNISTNTIILLIVSLIVLFANIRYFNKRAHLFVDKTVVTIKNAPRYSLSFANESSEKDSIYAIQKPSNQKNVSTLKILRKTTTGVGEITLEELQRERAEIEQRFGELKKVKDLLTPDAYYEAVDALSKEYDEVIAKIKLKL